MKTRWSQEETDKLRQLYKTNLTARQIAHELGRPLRAIYQKAHSLDLPTKPAPNKITLDVEQLTWLRQAYPHIRTGICAIRLGISPRSVIRIARKMKLKKFPKRASGTSTIRPKQETKQEINPA